jgi:hypothetical protein
MKTPTIIVRLLGLYLLTNGIITLLQVSKMQAIGQGFPGVKNSVVDDIQLYGWLGLLVGLSATLFAGPLARLLTFDSEPGRETADFSDRVAGRKD